MSTYRMKCHENKSPRHLIGIKPKRSFASTQTESACDSIAFLAPLIFMPGSSTRREPLYQAFRKKPSQNQSSVLQPVREKYLLTTQVLLLILSMSFRSSEGQ